MILSRKGKKKSKMNNTCKENPIQFWKLARRRLAFTPTKAKSLPNVNHLFFIHYREQGLLLFTAFW